MDRETFDFLYKDKVVYCPNVASAKEFLTLAEQVGYKWRGNALLTEETHWNEYKAETCYKVEERGLGYGNLDFFLNLAGGMEILLFLGEYTLPKKLINRKLFDENYRHKAVRFNNEKEITEFLSKAYSAGYYYSFEFKGIENPYSKKDDLKIMFIRVAYNSTMFMISKYDCDINVIEVVDYKKDDKYYE